MIDYFLDTSFLIPFFGMEINIKNLETDFEKILINKDCIFGYSDVSLIEIRFLIERAIKKGAPEELRDEYTGGMNALIQNDRFQNFSLTNTKIFDLEMGFLINYQVRDFFDRIIMATSFLNSKYLVTMDKQINSVMKIFNKRSDDKSQFVEVISWSQMMEQLNL